MHEAECCKPDREAQVQGELSLLEDAVANMMNANERPLVLLADRLRCIRRDVQELAHKTNETIDLLEL